MSQPVNRYRCDLRDMRFLLFEQFGLGELLGKPPFADWTRDDVLAVLDGVYQWSCEVLGPLNAVGDREGCVLENGAVRTPTGFKQAWKSLYEHGWRGLGVPPEHGGQGGPMTVSILTGEMMSGANTAFNMYPGLTQGVAEVIAAFGTPAQVEAYCKKLHTGVYAGTMCLTEPHAGSDVGAAHTRATPIGDGKYKIDGTKIFISAGDHDLTENILHLVLARTPDAPAGTKGLSLFIVPRDRLDGSGSNDVITQSLEHKMGINGSATAVLRFGENGNCIGELVGTEERLGMKQMFRMMNLARIGVGIQGLAVAGAAYLAALEYAGQRVQGPHIKAWKDPSAPKVPILQHPNIRRMLLDMKGRVEGIRALIVKLSMHLDRTLALRASGGDEKEIEYHAGQVDLLVPVVKAYASDQGFQVTVSAIQCFGGAGYIKDHPVEQYCRDSKIFSIYEGTNHIQALDLVGRKLGQRGGANFQAMLADIRRFVEGSREEAGLGPALDRLQAAADALGQSAMRFLGWFQAGKTELIGLYANRFLEMMAQTTVSWVLLEGGIVAARAARDLPEDHPDRAFYVGKHHAALHFAHLELPRVVDGARFMSEEMRHSLDIPDAGFGVLGQT
ncbi:MAG TPA: acyl-CoA dehydrogenase [Kofleriaceae bacterium]|nr:acyl-CoA dehydrogenase [Kofleriaceae bacterium]